MATNTTNYQLTKPADADYYNVADQNGNMDKIEAALTAHATSLSNKADEDTHNLLTFTALSQLGLDANVTPELLLSAMPDGSTLTIIGSPELYPYLYVDFPLTTNTYGCFTATKFTQQQVSFIHRGTYLDADCLLGGYRADLQLHTKWKKLATATAPTEYDLPLEEGFTVSGKAIYSKTQENIVNVNIGFIGALSSGGNVVSTLPSGYRPSGTIRFVWGATNNTTTGRGTILTDGTINIYCNDALTTTGGGSVTFVSSN